MSKVSEANERLIDPDFIADGFHKLDSRLMEERAPKIQWGVIYQEMSYHEKIRYLEKLAATMNHAAFLVQEERNHFGELCEKKEKQIIAMSKALDQNNAMIQQQVTKMNEDRQQYNKAIADLKKQVRELGGAVN